MTDPEFKLLDHPFYCPSGYTLDLYCKYQNPEHDYNEFPHGIIEYETRAESVKEARRQGWIVHRDNTATCPKCVRKLKEKK